MQSFKQLEQYELNGIIPQKDMLVAWILFRGVTGNLASFPLMDSST